MTLANNITSTLQCTQILRGKAKKTIEGKENVEVPLIQIIIMAAGFN